MVRTVYKRYLHIYDLIAGEHTRLHCALDALIDTGDILLGDSAAGDLVDKLIALAGLVGLNSDLTMCKLALTARLTGIAGIDGRLTRDGLLIGNLRLADISLDLELAQKSVNDDLKMKLAHTGDYGLARLFVGVGLEGRILLRQLLKRNSHLLLTGFGLGLDSNTDNRLGEFHGFKDDRIFLIAERIAGRGIFKADGGSDIAGISDGKIFSVVCVHQQYSADTLTLTLGRVQNRFAGFNCAGIDTEEAQTADKGVGHDLERECGERCIIGCLTGLFLICLGVGTAYCGDVQRRGHVIDYSVEQLLHAFVFIRSAADHGNHLNSACGLSDGCADHILRNLFSFEIKHHYLVVEIRDSFQHLYAVFLGHISHILGYLLGAHVVAEIIVINAGIHLNQIDYATEIRFGADRELDGHCIALKSVMHHIENMIEVRAHDIHLVYVYHTRNMIVIGLSPNCLGLRLNAALGTQYGHAAVKNAQRTLDLDGEVNVTRGINDIDSGIAPVAGGCCGSDGYTPLLLLLHPVHGRGTFMGLADLVVYAGIVKNTLGRRSLAGVDVSHDTDISGFFK